MNSKTEIKADKLPWTFDQIKANRNDAGYITAVVALSLDELFHGVACFNDEVSMLITGCETGLTNIAYKAVGTVDGSVLVEVTASVEDFIVSEEAEEEEEEEYDYWAKRLTCSVCGELCLQDTAHLHDGVWIGDECCWDDRLHGSE